MGYGEAPWRFTGQALYQLQLVKAEEAKKYVPPGLKLVQAFGYTLGGFYLARYKDSPVGSFDELVAMGGLVWNPPTSCAWAARVYVSNKQARNHGIASVGLPSRFASFNETPPAEAGGRTRGLGWWRQPEQAGVLRGGATPSQEPANHPVELRNRESSLGRRFGKRNGMAEPVCSLQLPDAIPAGRWMGPRISVALPSFSGKTESHPGMLRYACQLATNVSLASPARVDLPSKAKDSDKDHPESLRGILSGRPLVAIAFNNMVMDVDEPVKVE
eukprot:jgi/Tetstr1/434357/TSEL_023461.t1